MKTTIDLATWNRREHFEFFQTMDEPMHGVVVNVDCTGAALRCKAQGQSFFLTYLHAALVAANGVPEFRQRIETNDGGAQVVHYNRIHAAPTIARADDTFAFCLIEFKPAFEAFAPRAQAAMAQARATTGLNLASTQGRGDVVHFSVLPNIRFTGLTHARNFGMDTGIPKVTFGQRFADGRQQMLPVAVFVNHALVDGHHVGQYLMHLQTALDSCSAKE
jgi:chloramphenicol O-acetyltransferase type A